MKYQSEFTDQKLINKILNEIDHIQTRPWTLMEVCGGQTHAIIKYGLDEVLKDKVKFLHGPGCPVCVTPIEKIDHAIELAKNPNIILATFSDMLRVPGSNSDLMEIKAQGGNVKAIYSPLEVIKLAQDNPEKEVVFFAVGFETTAPANALALITAYKMKLMNFSLLVSHVRVPPAIDSLMQVKAPIDAFLAAGHVCTVMGEKEYFPLVEKYKIPIVITGFSPVDLLHGAYLAVRQLEKKEAKVENQYSRIVKNEGNSYALECLEEVFEYCPRKWRGLGEIDESGFRIKAKYACFDASKKWEIGLTHSCENQQCLSGAVLQGLKRPDECPYFGKECTPLHPLGATMVSAEGACSAYFQYRGERYG